MIITIVLRNAIHNYIFTFLKFSKNQVFKKQKYNKLDGIVKFYVPKWTKSGTAKDFATSCVTSGRYT